MELTRAQCVLALDALQDLTNDAGRLQSALSNVQPRGIPAPPALRQWIDELTVLRTAIHPSQLVTSESFRFPAEHASRIRTALALRRRRLAEEVSEAQRVIHDGEMRTALEQEYAPLDDLLRGPLRDTVPVRRPQLADYLTVSGLHMTTAISTLSDPEFDPKHQILLSSSMLENDLRAYRQSCEARYAPLAVLFADLDNFKAINTKLTEVVVDRTVLPQVLWQVEATTFGHGRAYRFGGDEFVVLLPNAAPEMALSIARAMARGIESLTMPIGVSPLSVSVGAWVTGSESHLTGVELIQRASESKQRAKDAGKRRVVIRTEVASGFVEQIVPVEA